MDHRIQDERYYFADEAICDAFLIVLKEKDLEKITVADVIKKAGIVRSTFYNHYENIPALVNAMENRTIRDIFALLDTFHGRSDRDMCLSFFQTICEYTMNNSFLASLLRSPRGDTFLEKTMTMFHGYVRKVTRNQNTSSQNREEYSYLVASTIGSTLGVLHKWTLENFALPAESVAEILTQVFLSGMHPFMP